jgi:hypothetical protein
MPGVAWPSIDVAALTFYSMMLDLYIASLREAAFEGRQVTIEEIANHYLDHNGLTPDEHTAALAIMLATAVARLFGAASASARADATTDDPNWNLGGPESDV